MSKPLDPQDALDAFAAEEPEISGQPGPSAIAFWLSDKVVRRWEAYAIPDKFIPPIYAAFDDGSIGVATTLFDCCGEMTDDPRFIASAVFAVAPNAFVVVAVTKSDLAPLTLH